MVTHPLALILVVILVPAFIVACIAQSFAEWFFLTFITSGIILLVLYSVGVFG